MRYEHFPCAKRVRIPSYSGPHFSRIFPHSEYLSVFSLNWEKNAKKMRTRITPNTDSFYVELSIVYRPKV